MQDADAANTDSLLSQRYGIIGRTTRPLGPATYRGVANADAARSC